MAWDPHTALPKDKRVGKERRGEKKPWVTGQETKREID